MPVNILEVFILKKYSIYIEKCKIPQNNLIKKRSRPTFFEIFKINPGTIERHKALEAYMHDAIKGLWILTPFCH